jgi:hypothetical protein
MDFFDSIKYLYLRELTEPRENSLRLIVQEAVVNPDGVVGIHPEAPELTGLLRDAPPIESNGGLPKF